MVVRKQRLLNQLHQLRDAVSPHVVDELEAKGISLLMRHRQFALIGAAVEEDSQPQESSQSQATIVRRAKRVRNVGPGREKWRT